MADPRTTSSTYLPPVPGADEPSDPDLGARMELQKALRDLAKSVQAGQVALQNGQMALAQRLELLDQRVQDRLSDQDEVLQSLREAEKSRAHAHEIEVIRRDYDDKAREKRMGEHSELVKAIPGILKTVGNHEQILDTARKARSAILLTLLEKAGGWLMAAIAALVALHFAGTPNPPAAPTPAPVTIKATVSVPTGP